MIDTTGLGIDDRHVLTCAVDALTEVSPTLAQTLDSLCRNPVDPSRLLAEAEDLMITVRPTLMLQGSSDYWLATLGDNSEDAFYLADKARRQFELMNAARTVCRRVAERTPAGV